MALREGRRSRAADLSPNRLINETSPYLLQHAHNPVEWQPWGPEALEEARGKDKPILLSIGYAACHWCHVMERESFEDVEVAALMNEKFVCIKVDREERPDIDAIYMDAVQAMTGHGGWPMTMFLTPGGVPFYGGTYFPPQDRHGLPSFRTVLTAVADAWTTRRDEAERQGALLVEQIAEQTKPRVSSEPLGEPLLQAAMQRVAGSVDPAHGGFGHAPKFPQPAVLELMLRAARRGDRQAASAVRLTLDKMARGGIYDQLGGGFSRYSVDRYWLVPHFEKMLYDNAQLARIYIHAWQLWKDPLHRRIAEETLEYLQHDLSDASGGFYSSEDADSEGVEGKFYVWDYEEFMSIAPDAASTFGVTKDGNFEGANILTLADGAPPPDARRKLLEVRNERVRPGLDDKILTSWNGLAITAFAEAGAALDRPDLVERAAKAADLMLTSVHDGGRLMHSFKDGKARILGMLEDYAYLADGLYALWEATFDPRWFDGCRTLCNQMIELFWDPEELGMFSTANDHEKLILRQKEIVESATPSPNAVASLVFQKMSLLLGDEDLARKAEQVLRVAFAYMSQAPQAAATFVSSLDFFLSRPMEIAILGERSDDRTTALVTEVFTRYLPNKVVAGSPPGIASPLLEGKEALSGVPTAFVCESYVCKAPVTEPLLLAALLEATP